MKKSFLKKIMIAFTAFAGVFVMASCQTTDHNATVPTQYSSVEVYTNSDGKKVATVTLAVNNPTIYNTTEITFKYDALDATNNVIGSEEVTLPVGIRHGVAGAFAYAYTAKEGEAENVAKVKITEAHISGYQTVWQTYMPAFICAIVLASMSVLFFAIELFARKRSKAELKEMFAEHMASEVTILGLVLIICLIPLIFSSWVTTVVLLGAFVASIVVNGLLTLIKMQSAE